MIKVRKNSKLYFQLKELDAKVFPGCDNEFQANREWWVTLEGDKINSYCGCLYKSGICVFVRAWVHRDYRNKGTHKKQIAVRINAAIKKKCKSIVTYTVKRNYASANNLIKSGFLLHNPQYAYAGNDVIYFIKHLY